MLLDNIMARWTHPLDLAAGAELRLGWAAGLLAGLWALILWALQA
jgi:hypothetical protein